MLPSDFISEKLASSSEAFREQFKKELALLSGERAAYEARVDTLLDAFIASYDGDGLADGSADVDSSSEAASDDRMQSM